jgi:hypothetical protein
LLLCMHKAYSHPASGFAMMIRHWLYSATISPTCTGMCNLNLKKREHRFRRAHVLGAASSQVAKAQKSQRYSATSHEDAATH